MAIFKELLGRGKVMHVWRTSALAGNAGRLDPRWNEVGAAYDAAHAKLVAEFPELAR